MGVTNKQRGRQIFSGGVTPNVRVASADGAVNPNVDGLIPITKAGVCAMTLAAPARDGIELEFISRTANAHTITATGLIDDGVTGGSKTTATFAAFAGASCAFRSYGGKWNTVSLKAVTVS
jgi:hypothetical protein